MEQVKAFLGAFLGLLLHYFLLPAEWLLARLNSQSWAESLRIPEEPSLVITLGVAVLFWVILFSLVGTAERQVRFFLHRNDRRR
ncbi:MAG: hypothetical protein DI582_00760 [Azospirillum brasilense]|nr:MAG: hypothetical protein DI582_00760 [Azospirillum brasilense]